MGTTARIEPTLDQLAALVARHPQSRADRSLAALRAATGGAPDPVIPQHCDSLLRWLNQWGCRIRLPRAGEPEVFARELAAWWSARGAQLPTAPLHQLEDQQIDLLAQAYADLAARPATTAVPVGPRGRARRVAPTAAAKLMFVLRPETVTAWDARIAQRTVGGTSAQHFAAHLRRARRWCVDVLAEAEHAGIDDDIPMHVGRPTSTVAKLLDEWHYLTITRGKSAPALADHPAAARAGIEA